MSEFSAQDKRFPANGEPLRVGFRLPTLRVLVSDKAGPVDFSSGGYTITFTAYNASTGAVKVNAASATGANGYLEYSWAAADTDTAGDYRGFFTVTDSSSKVQHIPRGASITYKIIDAGG